MEAHRRAALAAALATPEARERKRAARQKLEDERRDDPVWQAYKRASGQRLRRDFDASPVGKAKVLATRAEVGRKISAMRRAWCPDAFRTLDDELVRKDVLLADRKRIIGEEIARADRERIAALSPLERQLERVRAGGRVVEKFTPPSREHGFTLGGVATGML